MGLKYKAKKKVKRSEDMISRLPDVLLGHILSYLTTAESVRTAILSKRWSTVWSYVPSLDLDDSLMSHPDPDKQHAKLSSFIQFLNNVFNLHKIDSLEKLTFKCSKFDNIRVNEWVMFAMKCKVKELDLCITKNEYFTLGVPLFAYQDLVALKLGGKFVLALPGKVLLPRLKKLHLDHIEIWNKESCDKLLSGCPVLEYLHMESVDMEPVATLRVIAPLLKFLSLNYEDHYYPTMYSKYKVVVDAPNLEVLKCYLPRSYCFKNLDSLIEAYINVHRNRQRDGRDNINEMREMSLQLVKGIANAKTITFTGHTIEVLSFLDLSTLPMFNGLTKLVFVGDKSCGKLLPKFLQNSPFLQDLVLDLGYESFESDVFEWHDPVQVPLCLLGSLKSVKIWGFDGHNDMLKLIKYLQANGKVWGELSSGFNKEDHKELKVSKELLSLLLEK